MSSPPFMPVRREAGAPSFDPRYPHELPQYFYSIECFLTRSKITDLAHRKWFATVYAELDAPKLWRATPEYADPSCHFMTFKAAVFRLYPEVTQAFSQSWSQSQSHSPSQVEASRRARIAEAEREIFKL